MAYDETLFFPIDRQFHCSLTHLFFSSIFLNLINIDTVSQSSLQLHMETTINHQSVENLLQNANWLSVSFLDYKTLDVNPESSFTDITNPRCKSRIFIHGYNKEAILSRILIR
ncbi:hypothetical protein Hanom_Chr12g01170261 [Helianthus anomalus]